MDVILIPGLWLDAGSWRSSLPALEDAGHTVHPMTMPGVGLPAETSAQIGMADWVGAVIDRIDGLAGPVALVGHSGGGNVAWAVADRRPERVARVVFVDTVPPPDGAHISEFPVVDGVIPFPGWESFDESDVADLSADVRAIEAARATSVPPRVPTDPVRLSDPRRYAVPVVVLSGVFDESEFRFALAQWGTYGREFAAIADARVTRLGTGHWPQFSAPERLSSALVEALRARE